MKKTMFVIALVFCLLAAMTTAFAVSGKGTQDNPFRITTEEELLLLADFPDCHFELENDITFTGTWEPVADFSGSLDGKGHTITVSAYMAKTNTGFFGTLSGDVKNLTIYANKIKIESRGNAGVFAGKCSGTIQNCTALGEFACTSYTGSLYAGGLCGTLSGTISHAKIAFTNLKYVTTSGNNLYGGGICSVSNGTIEQCMHNSVVILSSSYHLYYSGLTAKLSQDASISNSMNLEISRSNTGSYTYYAGITYENEGTITNCYSVCGKSNGYGIANGGTMTNCFYDKTTIGSSSTTCGTPKSTLAMKMEMTYTDWDFENIWAIDESEENPINGGYPYLQFFYEDIVRPITVSTASVSGEHIVIDTKITDVADTYVLHIALYDADGRLCDYMMLPNDRLLKDVFAVFADNDTASYAKIFVWDALNVIEPTADCETLLITRE